MGDLPQHARRGDSRQGHPAPSVRQLYKPCCQTQKGKCAQKLRTAENHELLMKFMERVCSHFSVNLYFKKSIPVYKSIALCF